MLSSFLQEKAISPGIRDCLLEAKPLHGALERESSSDTKFSDKKPDKL